MVPDDNYERMFAEAAKSMSSADNVRYDDYIKLTSIERDRVVTRHIKWMRKYLKEEIK